ncbi:Protein of unknown function, partial [Cotesia congregata]
MKFGNGQKICAENVKSRLKFLLKLLKVRNKSLIFQVDVLISKLSNSILENLLFFICSKFPTTSGR